MCHWVAPPASGQGGGCLGCQGGPDPPLGSRDRCQMIHAEGHVCWMHHAAADCSAVLVARSPPRMVWSLKARTKLG